MTNREYYIRYRIYVNYSEKADRNYPRRLIKNIQNLHHNLESAPPLKGIREIKYRTFIPKNLKHVNPAYGELISYFAEYFGCLAIWETTMLRGTSKTINTFSVWGYEPNVLLAYHYITKIINSLNAMRYNLRREYREKRIEREEKGFKRYGKGTATTKSSKFFYKSLSNICRVIKEILENTPRDPQKNKDIENTYKEIRERKNIDFKAYRYKYQPEIRHAASAKGKFQNRRFILVNY